MCGGRLHPRRVALFALLVARLASPVDDCIVETTTFVDGEILDDGGDDDDDDKHARTACATSSSVPRADTR